MHAGTRSPSVVDIIAFERRLFEAQGELLACGVVPPQFAYEMSRMCRELADLIRSDALDVPLRVVKLREMYMLMRAYGFDVPN